MLPERTVGLQTPTPIHGLRDFQELCQSKPGRRQTSGFVNSVANYGDIASNIAVLTLTLCTQALTRSSWVATLCRSASSSLVNCSNCASCKQHSTTIALPSSVEDFSQKGRIPIRKFWMIKPFTNRGQIRLLNSKITDLDWYYSRHHQKLKFLICDLLFTPLVKDSLEPRVYLNKDTVPGTLNWMRYREQIPKSKFLKFLNNFSSISSLSPFLQMSTI